MNKIWFLPWHMLLLNRRNNIWKQGSCLVCLFVSCSILHRDFHSEAVSKWLELMSKNKYNMRQWVRRVRYTQGTLIPSSRALQGRGSVSWDRGAGSNLTQDGENKFVHSCMWSSQPLPITVLGTEEGLNRWFGFELRRLLDPRQKWRERASDLSEPPGE